MTRHEMETVLRYDAMEDCWYGWSCVSKHISAMKRRGWTLISEQGGYAYMKAPAHSVMIRSVHKPVQRNLSQEERSEIGKRLADSRGLKKLCSTQYKNDSESMIERSL